MVLVLLTPPTSKSPGPIVKHVDKVEDDDYALGYMTTLPWASKLNQLVGQRIAELRERHQPAGLTQQTLAAATHGGLSRSTIANIERGHQGVSLIQLFVLADVLDVEPGALLPSRTEVRGTLPSSLDAKLSQQPRKDRVWLQQMRAGTPPETGGDSA
jgi:transcriptional regulator with XRE-family HTH domain